ncbi:MAG: PaaI family thioesterase [Candidatus Andeanibacterium colombiense]|uniref:PaaI family thioesterase n=1 Tax=Candidatus Andeanibacterium colombiense TaxID=3121345 RepID=A0AAJ5X6I3_9SPHN|nr:MAG: PaaI family thioesterase [Sphingomonadaceae bacterium]
MPRIATLPETGSRSEDDGAAVHYRALESLYASAPINRLFASQLSIGARGRARIEFQIDERVYHAAGAAHGTVYFKMLDDAAFYAANSLVSDRFLLTTGFNLHFTKPVRAGKVVAEGRWISGKRRVFVAEAHLTDETGEEIGRGTGTFMRSRIALSGLPGYILPEAGR